MQAVPPLGPRGRVRGSHNQKHLWNSYGIRIGHPRRPHHCLNRQVIRGRGGRSYVKLGCKWVKNIVVSCSRRSRCRIRFRCLLSLVIIMTITVLLWGLTVVCHYSFCLYAMYVYLVLYFRSSHPGYPSAIYKTCTYRRDVMVRTVDNPDGGILHGELDDDIVGT